MVVLMMMFVMGSFELGAVKAATTVESGHMMDHAAPSVSDCPMQDEATDAPMQTGHAACMMTVCCFSDIPGFGALQRDPKLVTTSRFLVAEARLTQAEPERAKKPPKHT